MDEKAMTAWLTWAIKKHHRVQHGNNEFANSKSHIDIIENFWGIAEMRLAKFRGLSRSSLSGAIG